MEGYFNTPMKAVENLKKVIARTNPQQNKGVAHTANELMKLVKEVCFFLLFSV